MVRSPSVDKNGLRKGAWSEEEDNKLKNYVLRYGHWNWRQLPKFAGLARCGKSCRLRWMNYLRPGLKKGEYNKEEEKMIIKLHEELGNKWSAIAARIPGRTDNEIKNYWNSHLKKGRKIQDPELTEKTNEGSQNMDVVDQDSSMSLSESTDQKMESSDADIAAANASAEDISSKSYNQSSLFGDAENSFNIEELFPELFASFETEPFNPTSYNQISSSTTSSSSVLNQEDSVSENGMSLEELLVKSFEGSPTESVSQNSNDSNGIISPSASCNSTATHWDEGTADDAFEGFWTQPFCLDTSYSQSIHQLQWVEDEVMFPFTPFIDFDVHLFNHF